MDFNTVEEGRKLIRKIEYKIEEIESNKKEVELENYFEEINICTLEIGSICYLAIYVDHYWKGGVVKVKLEKRNNNEYHFVSLENDISGLKEWNAVSRQGHPYRVSSTKIGWRFKEPIPYSNVNTIRKAKVLKARFS